MKPKQRVRIQHLLASPLVAPPARVLGLLGNSLAKRIRYLPFGLLRFPMEHIMRTVLADAEAAGELQFLKGRWLQLQILDIGVRWNITLGSSGPIVVNSDVDPDVVIGGNLVDFLTIASADNDPDTLFFQRRIRIEGDTEISLWAKNTLFSVDSPQWVEAGARWMSELLQTADLHSRH